MFVFRKKNKPDKQIDQLLDLLKSDPENTKNRVRLADLYLRAGDKKSAITEYRTAARYLSNDGFNLKAISIYKKILTLDSMSLGNYRSLAALYSEEGLLAEARRTHEKILQIRPEDQEAREALRELERDGDLSPDKETRDNFGEGETQTINDSDPVPIESLLAPSEVEETPLDQPRSTPGESLEPADMGDLSDRGQTPGEGPSLDPGEDTEIDIGNIQADDVFDIAQPPDEARTDAQGPLHGTVLRDLTAEDISNADFTFEEIETPPTTAPSFDSTKPFPPNRLELEATPHPSGEDPDIHYNLGVAYREMELADKAIEEFTKALEQGTKPLECLIMLARCHFEKGLFQDAAEFIHRALKLEKLTQEQIDLLHRQLEEVEAVGKLD